MHIRPLMLGLMVLGLDLGRFNTDLTILCVRDRTGQKFIKSVSIKLYKFLNQGQGGFERFRPTAYSEQSAC